MYHRDFFHSLVNDPLRLAESRSSNRQPDDQPTLACAMVLKRAWACLVRLVKTMET